MDGWLSCYGVFFAGIVGLTFATWRFFEQSDGDDDDFWPDVKSERQYLTLLNDCITYVRN
jgi:hypothetical protein